MYPIKVQIYLRAFDLFKTFDLNWQVRMWCQVPLCLCVLAIFSRRLLVELRSSRTLHCPLCGESLKERCLVPSFSTELPWIISWNLKIFPVFFKIFLRLTVGFRPSGFPSILRNVQDLQRIMKNLVSHFWYFSHELFPAGKLAHYGRHAFFMVTFRTRTRWMGRTSLVPSESGPFWRTVS